MDVPFIRLPLGRGMYALVDEADYPRIAAYRWRARAQRDGKRWYVGHRGLVPGSSPPKRREIWLHRVILDAPDGTLVDHVNGDGLDNRRCNLRFASRSQNNVNLVHIERPRSGYRGVTLHRRSGRWQAQIGFYGKHLYLGSFGSPVDAALAYDKAAVELFGEFARPNFPQTGGR